MKKEINIKRENEFIGNINRLDILINKEKFSLSTNSSIKFSTEDEIVEIVVKYLWSKTKVLLNKKDSFFDIRVRPIISDKILLTSIISLILLFLLQYITDNAVAEFLFKLIGISFLLIFFYLNTIGIKYLYKIEIN